MPDENHIRQTAERVIESCEAYGKPFDTPRNELLRLCEDHPELEDQFESVREAMIRIRIYFASLSHDHEIEH